MMLTRIDLRIKSTEPTFNLGSNGLIYHTSLTSVSALTYLSQFYTQRLGIFWSCKICIPTCLLLFQSSWLVDGSEIDSDQSTRRTRARSIAADLGIILFIILRCWLTNKCFHQLVLLESRCMCYSSHALTLNQVIVFS